LLEHEVILQWKSGRPQSTGREHQQSEAVGTVGELSSSFDRD
jgi:hypothetical protein